MIEDHGWRVELTWRRWAFGVGVDCTFGDVDVVVCLGPLTIGWSR